MPDEPCQSQHMYCNNNPGLLTKRDLMLPTCCSCPDAVMLFTQPNYETAITSKALWHQGGGRGGGESLPSVLISARIELIFFPVAGIVLCFGVSMRMMLITHWCFSCCSVVLTPSFSFPCSAKMHKKLEVGTADPNWPKRYSILWNDMPSK